MKINSVQEESGWKLGFIDGLPLLGGYIPVAISFGVIAAQAGFTAIEATLISALVYAGASQFLLVAMVAAGSPLWLAVCMTLLVNVRHVVYAPNLAPHLSKSKAWLWLMHGLTDQVFALAHTRLPTLEECQKLNWFKGLSLIAWFSWIGGTALGAVMGDTLSKQWPLLDVVLPFALPALFIVLLAPRFSDKSWCIALSLTIVFALFITMSAFKHAAIPLAAAAGAISFFILNYDCKRRQTIAK
ncbi:AzlC family ABC transporter permease [Agaribacter flavus]|uniref:AzlC family ABC transporter permease n=1 Tax=Agaribacter flavus TaxID=1902781 RepID=A0ABV7FJ98_9ALTE